MIVQRHTNDSAVMLDDEAVVRYSQRLERGFLRIVEGKKLNFHYFKEAPINIVTAFILHNKKAKAKSNFQLHLDIGIGHFDRFISKSDITLELGGKKYNLPPIESSHGTGFFDWFKLFSIAMLIRSEDSLERLMNIDIFKLNEVGHPFWRTAIKFFRSLILQKEDISILIKEAEDIMNSGQGLFIGLAGKEVRHLPEGVVILKTVWFPILELYHLVVLEKEKEFNEKLFEYLSTLKSYIIEKDDHNKQSFWVNFPALACCAFAYDKGMKINVESEYIPQWVYEGKWID